VCFLQLATAREPRGRRERFTPRQKAYLFGLEVAADAVIIFGLLAVAQLRQTVFAWKVFGVMTVGVLVAAWWARKIYTAPPGSPTASE
jgi:hypothetical protein